MDQIFVEQEQLCTGEKLPLGLTQRTVQRRMEQTTIWFEYKQLTHARMRSHDRTQALGIEIAQFGQPQQISLLLCKETDDDLVGLFELVS